MIGQQLRLARLGQDEPLSMSALSRRLLLDQEIDLSANAIAKIEAGSRYALDYELRALARALQVSADWLLDLDPTVP